MGLLDAIVAPSFRDEKAGRVVVFTGDRRNRGYLVKSEIEERRISSFLKMFYAAHLSIFLLGYFLATEWSRELVYALGRPAAHLLRSSCIFLAIYSLIVGVPYLLLWRSYKTALLSFVSAEDEVQVASKGPGQRQVLAGVGLITFGILILCGVMWLVRFK